MRLGERLLRAVLEFAPRDFRTRYADEVLETYRRRTDGAPPGWLARTVLTARELAGGLALVIGLRTRRHRLPRAPIAAARPAKAARLFSEMARDLRYATRTLRRSPGYAGTAVVVLALGIGANTAIFSAVNAFFFRPLPFGDADRLVMVYETNPEFGWTHADAAPANVLDWREQVSAFTDVAMYSPFVEQVLYVDDGAPDLLRASAVTGNFFSVLNVSPALGRTFEWEETWRGRSDRIVLSHALWATRFGGDSSIIGRSLALGTRRVEVVGVMPPGFDFPGAGTELWTPMGFDPADVSATWFRRAHFVKPIARLAPGATLDAAGGQLDLVVRRLQADHPETNRVMGAGAMPLRDFLIRDVRRPLMILLGAVALLLMLACANVANLTLVRASERHQEMALRHALGAGRARVARQMLTESVLLGVVGGLAGLALGWAGVRAMAALTPLGIDGATSIALDGRVVLFTFAIAAGSGVLFGVAPSLRSPGALLRGALIGGGRGGSRGPAGARTVSTLVAVEVALALLLVAGAGLMLRSYALLRDVDPGFRSEGVLAFQFTVPSDRYPHRDNVLAFHDRLIERLESRQDIARVGMVGQLPLNGPGWSSQFQARGWPAERVGLDILHRRADRGYFDALGIPLVRGRMFDARDHADAPFVVVVNERFAREHFPGEDPIGQWIAYDRKVDTSSIWYEIIGIVGNQQQVSPAREVRAEVFEHRRQDWERTNWVVLRTTGDPMRALPAVQRVLAELDPLIPIAESRPLEEVWRASMAREQFILTLLGVFGVVALLLAAVGVYGVTAEAARKRTREIGIRMALGAAGSDLLRLMLRRSLTVVAIGLALGLAASLLAGRVLGSVLYGVAPDDARTLIAVVGLLAAIAGIACYLPARRAIRADPADSLRIE